MPRRKRKLVHFMKRASHMNEVRKSAASASKFKYNVEVPNGTPGPSKLTVDPLTTIKSEPDEQYQDPQNPTEKSEEPSTCEYNIYFEEEGGLPLMSEPPSATIDPLAAVKPEPAELHLDPENLPGVEAEDTANTRISSTSFLNKSCAEFEARDKWVQSILPGLISGYEPRDVFSALEFSLLYRLGPKQKLSAATAADLQLIRVLVCANSDGSETLPLLVITDNSKRSPKFCVSLPNNVIYDTDPEAKLTAKRFADWFRRLDLHFKSQDRKIVFFSYDNKTQNLNFSLQNIKVVHIATSSNISKHPLTNVVDLIRKFYRLRLLYLSMSSKQSTASVQDALLYLSAAWESVTSKDIRNGYIEAGFSGESPVETEDSNSRLLPLNYFPGYSNIIDDEAVSEQLALREELRNTSATQFPEIPPQKPLPPEVMASIQEVRRLLSMHPHCSDALHTMNSVENLVLRISSK